MTVPPATRREGLLASPSDARNVILALLAVAAGCVDAVSFLGLGRVLTAAMTGNTVLLGLALGQADAQAALRSAIALLGFFGGVLLGASIVERSPGRIRSGTVAAALGVELVVLLALVVTWHLGEGYPWVETRFALIATARLAMGVQSAVAHRIGVAGIATTYVTGTVTLLAVRLVGRLGRRSLRGDQVEAASSWLPAMVWFGYGFGAVCAGAAYRWWSAIALALGIGGEVRWSSAALLLPIVIVATVALIVGLGHRGRAARA